MNRPEKIIELDVKGTEKRIITLRGFHDLEGITHIRQKPLSLKDLSDIYYHPDSGNLLILSDESGCVVETTVDGKELGRLSLKKGGKSGLRKDIPRAEGITMDDRRVVFICSEPDLLFVFNMSTQ